MDDALNSSTWRQATFMDIIGPRVKNSTSKATPAKSHTLRRDAVKKPEIQTAAIDFTQPVEQTSQFQQARPDHTEAASLIERSPLVSRFTPAGEYQEQTAQEEHLEPIEVRQYPSMDGEVVEEPIVNESQASYGATALAIDPPSINIFKTPQPGTFEYSRPSLPIKANKWNVAKRLSGWSVIGIVAVGIIAGGLLVNRNFSKLELYVASSRAGFAATLPAARPSGYDLSSISTGGGVIEASFKSNSDNRNYSISEKKSSVTSSGLLNNYVASQAGANYQAVNTSGKTIYIYNGHDATWANNGIWYIIQDNNSLSDHQIINIANSM